MAPLAPPPSLNPQPPRPRNTGLAWLVAVLLVLVALVAIAALVWAYAPAREAFARATAPAVDGTRAAWSAFTLPSELRGARFLTSDGAYVAGRFGFERVATSTQMAPEIAAVYAQPYSATLIKANPRLGPAKRRVTFQSLALGSLATSSAGWVVYVVDAKDPKNVQTVGTGTYPFFLNDDLLDDHLAWFSDRGIILHTIPDYAARADATATPDRVLQATPFAASDFTMSISPDSKLVAYKDPDGHVEVVNVLPSGVVPVSRYDKPFSGFGVSNDALYLLERNAEDGTTDVLRFPFEPHPVAVRIATLPASVPAKAIAF